MIPETKYARSGKINIAYQVVGDGPIDLILVPGWISNIDVFWEEPSVVRFFNKLASFSRLILFDKRGTGLSDRVTDTPMLEQRMDDVRAVMDAVGSKEATLLGYSEAGTMVALFAATYPERTASVILIGSFARRIRADDYPFGVDPEEYQKFIANLEDIWGGPVGIEQRAPSKLRDQRFINWWAKFLRMGASPATALSLTNMNIEIDVRNILSSINAPALVLHALGDQVIPLEHGRYLAENIPNAKLVIIDSKDHLPWLDGSTRIMAEIEEFLTGISSKRPSDRVLSTLMFTDLVESTKTAIQLGDERWSDLLEEHNKIIRHELSVFRGKEIDTAGDGFFAAFDGPARALQCAQSILASIKNIGLELRIGLHTGECVLRKRHLSGIAVHIAARIMSTAGPNEILISRTVKDLVAGSGFHFLERGDFNLKGIPEIWTLYQVQTENEPISL